MSAVPSTTQVLVEHMDLSNIIHKGRALGTMVVVKAGNRGVEHVVPPAGDEFAFDRQFWAREVEVYVSPTGRSVRVYVDGVEIPARSR